MLAVNISIDDVSVDEPDFGTTPASFTISLSQTSVDEISVTWSSSAVSATASVDYMIDSSSTTVVFAPGDTTQYIDFDVLADTEIESEESFKVNLLDSRSDTIIVVSEGVATILDNDNGIIGDLVWDDLNGDGIQDAGEPGLDGVAVDLLDEFSGWLDSTTTDASGFYEFTGLSAGNYQLQFYEPMDYAFSSQDQGTDDTVDSDADAATGVTGVIVLGVEAKNDVDVGLHAASSIGDLVWNDTNGDGIQDENEPALGGVAVDLLDALGNRYWSH